MNKSIWFGAFILAFVGVSSVSGQQPVPVLPTSIDVLVIPANGDPNTVVPLAARNTPVSVTTNCNLLALPASPNPLINPTIVEVDDPFTAGRKCRLGIPVNLNNGNNLRIVAVANGTCDGKPCSSARSMVGVPFFDIAATQVPPAVLTGVAVKP